MVRSPQQRQRLSKRETPTRFSRLSDDCEGGRSSCPLSLLGQLPVEVVEVHLTDVPTGLRSRVVHEGNDVGQKSLQEPLLMSD